MKLLSKALLILPLCLSVGCFSQDKVPGSAKNPLKFHLVPATDATKLAKNAEILKRYLEANTPYKYQMVVPESFGAVVDAFGEDRADIAAINTSGYYQAHSKFKVEARLTILRYGMSTYRSQFLAHKDGKIKKLQDLAGKKVAFVDPASTSGYLLPLKTLKDLNISPKETVFALKHDAVVAMIYDKQVEAGATYYNPPQNGEIEDARRLLRAQHPDVEKQVRIIELSEPIPNDPIVFRHDLPEEMKEKIVDTLLQFAVTQEGRETLDSMLGATNFKKTSDADYESVREMFKKEL